MGNRGATDDAHLGYFSVKFCRNIGLGARVPFPASTGPTRRFRWCYKRVEFECILFYIQRAMRGIVLGCNGMRVGNGRAVDGPKVIRTKTLIMEQRDSRIEISLLFV